MTDVIHREIAEIERQRDAFNRLDRISGVERDIAVLKTRFEGALDHLLKELERSVSAEDLRQIKREWETALRDSMSGVGDLLKSVTDSQSATLLAQMDLRLAHQQALVEAENKRTRQEIIRYGVGFALTILSALVIFWITRNG
jgi:hypothetical protein